ncbi:lytic murein transglycosylase B [Alkalilimnicola ehrlichii]|uniref:Lytic murein transglycosylase B n=2 Tax=Alkalilimnicola ehrlichii TaxID=351052 RepID=A0A3E0X4L8_9GAMM|nr:lytic murein transglycosylase B [Alkalilimnicola ehrlichii]RFA39635.1 lytic murein transglycosylase B [Alkalilimnicola ehrlichii]
MDFSEHTEVQRFIDEVSERHGLDRAEVAELLGQAKHRQEIIDAITRPAEGLPWYRYRPIFLTDERIRLGVAYWKEHQDILERVSAEYGVAPEILVAIVGVETYYGRYRGRHRVIDALATLAFDYPPRGSFFRRELEHFLLLTREEGIDPLVLSGSYAGAMGVPQFISSSYRAYAVDGSNNGRRDLFSDPADILASVANYFRRHGWRDGDPVVATAQVSGNAWRELLVNDLRPRHSVAELRQAGIQFNATLADDRRARLLELETEDGAEHWVTLQNFYVITRYNHSPLYAMAVHQLSEAIREQREAEQ